MKSFSIWDKSGHQQTVKADSGTVERTASGLNITFKAGKKSFRKKNLVGFTEIAPPIKFKLPENDEDSLAGGGEQDE